MAFSFSDGKETAIARENSILTDINDSLTDLLKTGFGNLLEQYPWMVTKEFMQDICMDLNENLIPDLTKLLEGQFSGEGGFVRFAAQSENAEGAVGMASSLQRRLIDNLGSFLANYDMYADQLEMIRSRPESIYNVNVLAELRMLLTRCSEDLESKHKRHGNAIADEAADNNFLYPMNNVNETIFQYLRKRFDVYMESVSSVEGYAEDLLQEAERKMSAAAETAEKEAKKYARRWEFKPLVS